MYYKIIVYKKHYINIETKRGISRKVYFQKIATYHDIHKAILSKKAIEIYQKYNDTCFHLSEILEGESDIIIEGYNQKVTKYRELIGV